MPLRNKPPSTWPLLISIIVTAGMGLLWVYAGSTFRPIQPRVPPFDVKAPTPAGPLAKGVSQEFCDKMRRDIANDAVEFDPDSPFEMAIVKLWDADCRSRHGFAILK